MKIYYLEENVTIVDDDESTDLQSIAVVKQLFPRLITVAQKVYDNWDEDDVDTYANGGICHLIADEISSVLVKNNVNCSTVSDSYEQHVYTVVQVIEGVYSVDIHHSIYEVGAGFTWKKINNVTFDVNDISLYRITADPSEFDDMIDY
jgi:hypothetical protein